MLMQIEGITHRPELSSGGVDPDNCHLDKSRLREFRIGKADVEGLQNKNVVTSATAWGRAAGSVRYKTQREMQKRVQWLKMNATMRIADGEKGKVQMEIYMDGILG
jgi:hypothetical protein